MPNKPKKNKGSRPKRTTRGTMPQATKAVPNRDPQTTRRKKKSSGGPKHSMGAGSARDFVTCATRPWDNRARMLMKVPDACGSNTVVMEAVTNQVMSSEAVVLIIPNVQVPLLVWGNVSDTSSYPSFVTNSSMKDFDPDSASAIRTISLYAEVKSIDTTMNTKGFIVAARVKPAWGVDTNGGVDRRQMSQFSTGVNTLLNYPSSRSYTLQQGCYALAGNGKFQWSDVYPVEIWNQGTGWGPLVEQGGTDKRFTLDTKSGGLILNISGSGATSYLISVRHCFELIVEPTGVIAPFSSPNTQSNPKAVDTATALSAAAPVAEAIGTVVSTVAPIIAAL